MEEGDLEKELDRSYKLGISEGLQRAGDYIMKLARISFEKVDDISESIKLKNIAKELYKYAQKEHPGERN